jgi:hypothetical protein
MRLRLVIVFGSLVILGLLASTGEAWAAKWWPIADAAGNTVAYTRVWAAGKGVSDAQPRTAPWDSYNVHIVKKSQNRWLAWMGVSGLINIYLVRHSSGIRWRIVGATSGRFFGRVLHRGGRWVTQFRDNGAFRTIGRVDDGCPIWLAGAATYVNCVGL